MTATVLPSPRSLLPSIGRDRLLVISAAMLCALLAAATMRHAASAGQLFPSAVNPWLVLHLATVIPAVPLGAYVLVRRKGDRMHRLLGRLWVALMMGTALFSFGLHYVTGGFSWIHLLSILTLVSLPRSILMAVRGNIPGHMRGMRAVYIGTVIAGGFTFVPGRMLGQWLFG